MRRSLTILTICTYAFISCINNGVVKSMTIVQDSVVISKVEIIDIEFYNQLDSLIKFEKKCMHSSLKELHWVFDSNNKGGYMLTAESGFGRGKIPIGYYIIDSSIVFFRTNEPRLFINKHSDRKLTYVYTKKDLQGPEDYSVWIFKFIDKRLEIVKSYTLPCN